MSIVTTGSFARPTKKAEKVEATDAVNSPSHYTSGKFETIEVIEEIAEGYDSGYAAYCVGNVIKYLARAPYKHDDEGLTDLRKARKYLDFTINHLEKKGY